MKEVFSHLASTLTVNFVSIFLRENLLILGQPVSILCLYVLFYLRLDAERLKRFAEAVYPLLCEMWCMDLRPEVRINLVHLKPQTIFV
jgi:hypothetical protein